MGLKSVLNLIQSSTPVDADHEAAGVSAGERTGEDGKRHWSEDVEYADFYGFHVCKYTLAVRLVSPAYAAERLRLQTSSLVGGALADPAPLECGKAVIRAKSMEDYFQEKTKKGGSGASSKAAEGSAAKSVTRKRKRQSGASASADGAVLKISKFFTGGDSAAVRANQDASNERPAKKARAPRKPK